MNILFKTNSLKIQYFLYVFFILLTYINNLNVIPLNIKWALNKVWYINIFILTLLIFFYNRNFVLKKTVVPLVFMLMYSCFLFISYLFNFGLFLGFSYYISIGLCYFFIFYCLLMMVDKFSIESLMFPFFISSIFVGILSLCVFFGYQPNYYIEDSLQLENYLELKFGGSLVGFSGVYLNQNSFSLILMVGVIASFLVLQGEYKLNFFKKIITLFIFLLFIIFLFLTMSRAAIFSIFILFILFFLRGINSKINFYMLCVLSIFFAGVLIVFNDFYILFAERVNNAGTSNRTEIWKDAFDVFLNNPYFGVGLYGYINVNGVQLSAHNVYYNMLASTGIFSFLAWLLVILIGFFKSIKNFIELKFNRNKNLIFISIAFICILIHQFFENTVVNISSPLTLFFLLLISILILKN